MYILRHLLRLFGYNQVSRSWGDCGAKAYLARPRQQSLADSKAGSTNFSQLQIALLLFT